MAFNFGNFLSKIISIIYILLREFWWLIIPSALFIYFIKIFKTYKTLTVKIDDDPLVFLELKFSVDSFKQPVTSMKNFFENLKNIKIKDGKKVIFEIFCFKNQLRYICITNSSLKDLIEVAFYSQYPDIKINVALDYLSTLPPNIPNNNFDIWGEEYKLKKENIYQLNVVKNDIVSEKDSKIIDPITILLEATAKSDYQGMILIQIVLSQLNDKQKDNYKLEGDNVINKLLGKPVVTNKSFRSEFLSAFIQMMKEAAGVHDFLKFGESNGDKKEEKKEPSAEDKAKAETLKTKNNFGVFAVNLRSAYISPKICTEKFVSSSVGMFIKQFASSNNSFDTIPDKGTEYKVEGLIPKWLANFTKEQTELSMKKDLFQRILNRKLENKIMILNSEELATIYHFPFQKVSANALDYIKNKENAPPANLPIVD